MNALTEEHINHLAKYMYRTGRADTPEIALSEAREQVLGANRANVVDGIGEDFKAMQRAMYSPTVIENLKQIGRANAARTEAAIRQEAARRLRDCFQANQQSAARQRHTGRTLDRLTAAVAALGRR